MNRLTAVEHKKLGFPGYAGSLNPYSVPLTVGEIAADATGNASKIIRETLTLLSQYEDTGLTPDEIAALRAENDAFKADIEAGNLVRLPGELIAPYELNARYWICGWDSDACTLTIQDRALMDEAARAALEGGQHE